MRSGSGVSGRENIITDNDDPMSLIALLKVIQFASREVRGNKGSGTEIYLNAYIPYG